MVFKQSSTVIRAILNSQFIFGLHESNHIIPILTQFWAELDELVNFSIKSECLTI